MQAPRIPASVIGAMDGLTNLAEEILTAASSQTEDASVWARFFLARCLDAFASLRLLVEADQVVDAMAMARVLYEAMISFLYIFEGGQDDAQRRIRLLTWRRHGFQQILKRERHLVEVGLVTTRQDRETSDWTLGTATAALERIERDIADLGAGVRRDPPLIDKAKALGLEETYAIVFRQASDALHTSPMLLGEYAVAGGRGGTRMAEYGSILMIVAGRTLARVCAGAGVILGDRRGELARHYSDSLGGLNRE